MSRKEFSVKTKEDAWDRSGGACEADGATYGLPMGVRCGADMTLPSVGVYYDHVNPDALSKNNSLENCGAVCRNCHDWKTRNRDMPLVTDSARLIKRGKGIRRTSGQPMAGTRASGFKRCMDGSVVRR